MADEAPARIRFSRRRRANADKGPRLHRHVVKVTPEEELALLVKCNEQGGITVARLLVESALSTDRVTASQRQESAVELFAIRRLLAGVSNNVNQLARQANAGGPFPLEASATLAAVRRVVQRLDAQLLRD
ncbi:plasmid mobilization relaxosome protein MobC [Kineococcus sp. T90]|nr:plasmid mobilization relaxosome protein MobC [Kineococcus indalonis]